ncbi:hypothetical protein J2X31_002398 [Flavobacterium arsenatis]|uniref:Bacterial Ig-like domain-containing protein n=1 Tax=Flavobacterium arsenatis TaxID=1484332 RepID=A0ABU1TQX2_9FLAO|nr:Ig-like domain-containing protein [Flavobacterium arsenatis]MDR6968375.1 hypothetical protein [Flavobacterium arsenatis]
MASTTMFVSCGSDDNGGTPGPVVPVATSITLSVSLETIQVGQSVTLTVTDNLTNNVTSTSTFTANNVALPSATFTPTEAGSFSIVAKYETADGVLTSAPKVITVTAAPVPSAGKYTFAGNDYEVDNMFFRIHGTGSNATVLNFGSEEQPDYRSLWAGIAYNGAENGIATATHYYEYMVTIPVLYDGTNFTLQYPGEAEAEVYNIYADFDQAPFDLEAVTGGSATFDSFNYVQNGVSSSANSSVFGDGANTIISHEFDGDLTTDLAPLGVTNLLGSSRSNVHNKTFPATMIKMKDLKKVIPASKAKVQSFKAKR